MGLLQGLLWGRPRKSLFSHFELFLVFPGFGGSRRSAVSQSFDFARPNLTAKMTSLLVQQTQTLTDICGVLPSPDLNVRALLKGGEDLNSRERHSRDTRDDGTVTLCTLRAATVLSRDCRADFGRRLTKKVMSHSRDGPGVTAPLRTNIIPLTGVWNPRPSVTPP